MKSEIHIFHLILEKNRHWMSSAPSLQGVLLRKLSPGAEFLGSGDQMVAMTVSVHA
jgi:hypothetical protein